MSSGEAGVGWGVGGGGGEGAGLWARIGSLLSKHLANASYVWVVARKRRPRWCGVGGGGDEGAGGVWARIGSL